MATRDSHARTYPGAGRKSKSNGHVVREEGEDRKTKQKTKDREKEKERERRKENGKKSEHGEKRKESRRSHDLGDSSGTETQSIAESQVSKASSNSKSSKSSSGKKQMLKYMIHEVRELRKQLDPEAAKLSKRSRPSSGKSLAKSLPVEIHSGISGHGDLVPKIRVDAPDLFGTDSEGDSARQEKSFKQRDPSESPVQRRKRLTHSSGERGRSSSKGRDQGEGHKSASRDRGHRSSSKGHRGEGHDGRQRGGSRDRGQGHRHGSKDRDGGHRSGSRDRGHSQGRRRSSSHDRGHRSRSQGHSERASSKDRSYQIEVKVLSQTFPRSEATGQQKKGEGFTPISPAPLTVEEPIIKASVVQPIALTRTNSLKSRIPSKAHGLERRPSVKVQHLKDTLKT